MYKSIFIKIIFIACCFFCKQPIGLSQSQLDTLLFPLNFFESDEIVTLSLKFDLKKFIAEKEESKYHPAELAYYIDDSVFINKNVKLKSRGINRLENCYIPPYWLKVDDKSDDTLDDESFIKKVKVVSHCENTNTFNNYLLKEYLAYKIFNLITDYSFRVKLVKIKYIDTGRDNRVSEYWGFLVEPEDIMAERLYAYPIKMDNASYRLTDTLNTATMNIFQYMIGNTDYSISGRHNIKLIKSKDHTKLFLIPIPYDFDYSGLVNTTYARPNPALGISHVTQRYYNGVCETDKVFLETLNRFKNKKDVVLNYIDSFPHLNSKNKKYVTKYIREFYEEIERDDFIEKKIRSVCDK